MYTKNLSKEKSKFSRPSFRGGSSRFGGNGSRGGRGNFGGRQRVQPKRPQHGEYIDFSRFINKAIVSNDKTEHFVPEHNFEDFEIEKELKEAIISKGYKLPTPIQDQSIPHILKGGDIVGIANTGTGKTAAFLIPLINKVRLTPKEQVIILVPTRELAIQINQELKEFVRGIKTGMKIFSVVCVGGASIGRQISELRYKNSFIIGTPGRVKDLIERGMIRLPEFSTIVLDEADRMLDMGFINDIRFVISRMPKVRHTLFFSATLSPTIEKLIHEFLKIPMRVSVKTRDTAKNVEQDIIKIKPGIEKIEILHDLLIKKEFNKVLIFGRTKHGVEKLSNTLIERGFKAESIHGDKNHAWRQRSLASFKENKVQVLVATDVVARGLDIPDVSHVINYDIPATYDDYVHRIGRTGRVDKKGIALTFVS
ncbi:MAG: DEAD/DEAH box helicase [Patescibacteria group bacterium]